MPIPLHTTTIAVLRVPDDATRDPYDPKPAAAVVASGVRANIASPNGRERVAGGSQEVVVFRLQCDPVDLRNTDQVRDEATGELYEVVWTRPRQGPANLAYQQAELKQVEGVAP